MQTKPIYLDNCATTRIDPTALEQVVLYFDERFGNAASSSHSYGWEAQTAVESAIKEIASLIGASARELVLTCGATESNNLAITGFAQANRQLGNHIITCQTEHKSVLDTCAALEADGFDVTYLDVDSKGRVSLDDMKVAIRPGQTILVSIMLVNNETGTIQPINEIAELCRANRIKLHVDGTQAVGKIPVDVNELPVDLLSFSAHKIHGPKGIGALYVRRQSRIKLAAQMHGGQHQRGLRSGTLAVPLIVGFGVACRVACEALIEQIASLSAMRDRLEQSILEALPDTIIHGDTENRSPIVTNLGFPEVDGESLLVRLDRVAVSAGSACTSATGKPSYVLLAMGIPAELAKSSLRMSVGKFNTVEEIDDAAQFIVSVVKSLRQVQIAAA